VLTDAVADLTVMLVLMAMRRAGEAMRAVDEGQVRLESFFAGWLSVAEGVEEVAYEDCIRLIRRIVA
jgi:lactate dehydrogenase-like 2-hydroxyacid dehydrogenase